MIPFRAIQQLGSLGANDPAAEQESLGMWKAANTGQGLLYAVGLPAGLAVVGAGVLYALSGKKKLGTVLGLAGAALAGGTAVFKNSINKQLGLQTVNLFEMGPWSSGASTGVTTAAADSAAASTAASLQRSKGIVDSTAALYSK